MAVTQEELDRFHRFASEKLGNGGGDLSWDELFIQWESICDQDDVNAAIKQGLADVDAGRHRPASEVMEDLQRKHKIGPE